MSTIKNVRRCQSAGRYEHGTNFKKGDYIPNENRNKFIVTLIEGGIHIATRLLLLVLIGKKTNQHITQKDLDGLKGKKIDPNFFKD
ncbi:MAG: hypothetical protein MJZ64_05845 [Paludibacteraceae bacterium]|nr:hypothetical protein [Paludibacteraceae bacterium]